MAGCRAHLAFLITVCIIIREFDGAGSDSRGSSSSLARRKRYVVFPEGSTFSIALCLTIHTLTPDDTFTEGVNWGISYDLPNESKPALEPFLQLRRDRPSTGEILGKNPARKKIARPYAKYNRFGQSGWPGGDEKRYLKPGKKRYYKSDYYYLQRRHRRDLYNKLEVILNAMNLDGRACVLRALCEASQRLMPKGSTLIEEMMRISFSLPLKRIFSFEPEDHHTYADAHRAGHQGLDCASTFSGCSFSLIDAALGKYDSPVKRQDRFPARFPGFADRQPARQSPKGWIRYHMR